ncbi:MAG: response regulator transcription factor [Thaumarchaeota archaeon]|nr:MAG: response regulator transcription factor [Nitrososphaerota archaeon]
MKKLMKLLLIDDNKDITTMFSKYFTQKGHPCTVCNNSHNALGMITTGQYDMVLLDLAMPEVSGTDIVDALYRSGKIGKLNIVALTASSVSSEKEEELKKKGVNGVLKKPIDPDELLDYLQQTHTKLINR